MDSMEITILSDGTIKVQTDRFSPAQHLSAEKYLAEIEKLVGGETKISRKTRVTHTHNVLKTGN